MPAAFGSVPAIVRGRAPVEMLWVDARRVIAGVAGKMAFRARTMRLDAHIAMNPSRPMLNRNRGITVRLGKRPHNACVWKLGLHHEAIVERLRMTAIIERTKISGPFPLPPIVRKAHALGVNRLRASLPFTRLLGARCSTALWFSCSAHALVMRFAKPKGIKRLAAIRNRTYSGLSQCGLQRRLRWSGVESVRSTLCAVESRRLYSIPIPACEALSAVPS